MLGVKFFKIIGGGWVGLPETCQGGPVEEIPAAIACCDKVDLHQNPWTLCGLDDRVEGIAEFAVMIDSNTDCRAAFPLIDSGNEGGLLVVTGTEDFVAKILQRGGGALGGVETGGD